MELKKLDVRFEKSIAILVIVFLARQLEEYSTDISTELGKGYNVGITSIFNADVEDLIYLGSEIAEILNQEILNSEDPYEKIKKFDEFIKESFQLKSPNKIGRYLASILSKNSAKLYQTVSAIATLTLSQMGIKTLLIYGKAHEIHSWKPHVWNAVKIHGGVGSCRFRIFHKFHVSP